MPHTKIWGSLSLLTGAVIAVLALARGAWQLWLLLAVFSVWGLWLVLTVLLPYAAAKRRQRKAYRQAEERQPAAGGEYHRLRAESLKRIPPGKVGFRPFREFVCIGEDFTKCSEGVRDERPRSR